MKQKIYLDYAAATPMDPSVLGAMKPYFSDNFYNPSAMYLSAKSVKADLEKSREKIALWLGAKPSNIIFTAGGTEANNLALFGVVGKYPRSHIVSSALEHESVLKPLESLKSKGWDYSLVTPQKDGIIDPKAVQNSITENTVLVSIMYANNEIGTIQPLKEISKQISEIRSHRLKSGNKLPIYLHTDACQAAAYLDLHVANIGVDLMTINGGKIYGPKQSGALYVSSNIELEPIIFGGGQERGLRNGTENVPSCIGFSAALELVQSRRHQEVARLKLLQKLFIGELEDKLPKVVINGSTKSRLPNNVHITIPNQDNERLLFALDEAGVQCAAGSACSASSDEPSHVLNALGLSEEVARASLRFSMGQETSEEHIKTTVSLLAKIVA